MNEEFREQLQELINSHSIENICNVPDFLLSEMICNFIQSIGPSIKSTLEWHGCESVCGNDDILLSDDESEFVPRDVWGDK